MRRMMFGGLSALALTLAATAGPAHAQAYYGAQNGYGTMGPGMMGPGYGYGMMGPGMMGPGMMGYGMMGYGMMGGYGPGGYGPGGYGPGMGWAYGRNAANLNLSVKDVKAYLDRWIAVTANPHLKAGPVTEKDADTITADIVTTDKDALAQRYAVDRHSGLWRPTE